MCRKPAQILGRCVDVLTHSPDGIEACRHDKSEKWWMDLLPDLSITGWGRETPPNEDSSAYLGGSKSRGSQYRNKP